MNENIPSPSVRRLSVYLRQLKHLTAAGVKYVSSGQLAECMKIGAAMVRRDLSLFGQFGCPGVGYDVAELVQALRSILGTQHQWNVVIMGAGELCRALLRYSGFSHRGFELVAAFDIDPKKVDTLICDIRIHHVDELSVVVSKYEARLAILAVPADVAQSASELLLQAGIRGILNFATAGLDAPPNVSVSNVDITAHLEQLSFHVSESLAG
jgi:redox-sensing transcriptional repressor